MAAADGGLKVSACGGAAADSGCAPTPLRILIRRGGARNRGRVRG